MAVRRDAVDEVAVVLLVFVDEGLCELRHLVELGFGVVASDENGVGIEQLEGERAV